MTPARLIAAVCVIVPFIAVLGVPIYDKDKPEVAGFPFFFWWQLLWVAVTAALMGLAYFVVRREELARKPAAVGGTVAATAEAEKPASAESAEESAPAEPAEEPEQPESDGAEESGDATEEGDSE